MIEGELITLADALAEYCLWLESRISELESALANQGAWSEIGAAKHRSNETYQKLMDDRKEFAEEWQRRKSQRKGWAD
jgi:hypothetical protein